ncbi:RNA-binding protein 12-like [Gadus chalcogrammus]|uniref:RNA-binding protein 12-like n=1 Tax=Gadus chalcogrammus TaxID=1042646 RepID=UPI0024C48216|nr:RNA-binding protein 12-like [Gadus chalcogrammus]
MAVVIRLQGLPIVAGTMDIRHFFSGLTIPDGGVHIVGGEHGEAFIVFATDEDARLGMMRTGGAIKTNKVSLLLSSKTEMQNMIELSRRRFETGSAAAEAPAVAAAGRQGAGAAASQASVVGRSGGHGNQGFGNAQPSVTTASSHQEQHGNKVHPSHPNLPPSFANSYSSGPGLAGGPPPIPPLPALPSMPGPPPSSALPPVPTASPLPHMSHLPHMSSLPPFNPSLPPPGGLASALALGPPNPMLFSPLNPLNPLASLGLHMKAAAAAAAAGVVPGGGGGLLASPDELFVLLQNLPFTSSELEVREMFRGLGVEAVRLLRDNQGRGTGRAMVKFFSPQDGMEVVKRGGGMMGQRYVDVSPATERQWVSLNNPNNPNANNPNANNPNAKPIQEAQIQEHHRGNVPAGGRERCRSRSPLRQGGSEWCVYLKGLPYEAEKRQIQEFFKNLSLVEDSVYIAYGPNGRATGEGFLEFKTEQDYKTALSSHMQYMGSRFIQVHPINRKGMLEKIDSIRKRSGVPGGDGKTPEVSKSPRNCAHITNIPYNVSKKDVRAFLDGVGVYEDSLKVLSDNHGNGLGQAVFQLRTEEDARKAERLHRQKLNGRDAFVHLVTYEQMKDIERNPPPQNKRGQRNQSQPGQQQQQQQQPSPQQNLPSPHQAHQINPFAGMSGEEFNFLRSTMGSLGSAPFVSPFANPGNGLVGPPPLPPLAAGLAVTPPLVAGLPGGPGGPILEPPGFRPGAPGGHGLGPEALRALAPFDGGNRKPTGVPGRGAGGNNNQNRQGGGGGGGNNNNNNGQQNFGPEGLRNQQQQAPGNPGNQRPGCPSIVKLQNMPFTVTVDEIMDFFYGYQVLPGSVCLQLGEKGLPTGEAMVAFHNHQEASSAVLDLNDRPIGARKVKVTLG